MIEADVGSAGRTVPVAFVVASVPGLIHAMFSIYWGLGGTLLVWSLGDDLVQNFLGREWLLVLTGAAKLIAAVAPIILAWNGWHYWHVTRLVCWLGAAALLTWGGLNTLVANSVLAGLIQPGADFDRAGMVGHAYLWDPLFFVWGAALVWGLIASRRRAI